VVCKVLFQLNQFTYLTHVRCYIYNDVYLSTFPLYMCRLWGDGHFSDLFHQLMDLYHVQLSRQYRLKYREITLISSKIHDFLSAVQIDSNMFGCTLSHEDKTGWHVMDFSSSSNCRCMKTSMINLKSIFHKEEVTWLFKCWLPLTIDG